MSKPIVAQQHDDSIVADGGVSAETETSNETTATTFVRPQIEKVLAHHKQHSYYTHDYDFAVLRENLLPALREVGTAIANKPTLPILANVAIVAANHTLTLKATDLEASQVVKISAKIDRPVQLTVPYRTLRDIVQLAADGRIDFSWDEQTSRLYISQSHWRSTLKGIAYDEYPSVKGRDEATLLATVDYVQFLDIAKLGKRHATKDDKRPVLTCAGLTITGAEVQYITADSYSLFSSTLDNQAQSSGTYRASVDADKLYKILSGLKKNKRFNGETVSLYGTQIDEAGQVKGVLFVEDNMLQTVAYKHPANNVLAQFEHMNGLTGVIANSDDVPMLNNLAAMVWKHRKATRIEVRDSKWQFVTVAYQKKSRNRYTKREIKGETSVVGAVEVNVPGYAVAIWDKSVELAEYLHHTAKALNPYDGQIQVTRYANFIKFSHTLNNHQTHLVLPITHVGKQWTHKHQTLPLHNDLKLPAYSEAQYIGLDAIRWASCGLEFTGEKILLYHIIQGEKSYHAVYEVFHPSQKWHTMLKEAMRYRIPSVTVTRPRYLMERDKQQIIDVTRHMIEQFECKSIVSKTPELHDFEAVLNTNEHDDYAFVWQDVTLETPLSNEAPAILELEQHQSDSDSSIVQSDESSIVLEDDEAQQQKEKMLSAFKSIGFDARNIYAIFEYVEIADKFIEDTIRKYPDRAADVWDTFKTLQPSSKMMKMHMKLYDAHIEELMARVLNGGDLRPATRAEILVALSDVASIVPMHNTPVYLFYRLFKHVFGSNHPIVRDIDVVQLNEPYAGAADKVESDLRHKLRVDDRHQPNKERWQGVSEEKKHAILGSKYRAK